MIVSHPVRRGTRIAWAPTALCVLVMIGCAPIAAPAPAWTRTELYLGLTRPAGADVTDAEFAAFLDEVVTPRFPQGFTILHAEGRWREETGRVRVEPSRVLVIVHPNTRQTRDAIEQIRNEYKQRFAQEAVLRTDHSEAVSF